MNIEEEIEKIKFRNKKVETDKAWETSCTRKVTIAFATYIVMICVMYVLKMENPFISAIMPTLGFILSTISANLVKKFWIKKIYR